MRSRRIERPPCVWEITGSFPWIHNLYFVMQSIFIIIVLCLCECQGKKRERERSRVPVRMLKRISQKSRKLQSSVRSCTKVIQSPSPYPLRNRKHVPCFYRVIETRVKVWENEKCCGNKSRRLYNSIETQRTCFLFLLENTATQKKK